MSKANPYHRSLSLAGIDTHGLAEKDLRALFRALLQSGIHGLSFSPYTEGQDPDTVVTEGPVRDRMKIIAPYVKHIRSFSCTDGNELIPGVARELGLKSMVGAWIDDDLARNEQEIEGLIHVARAGQADILAVGNEVLLRDELSEDQLIDYIQRVRAAAPGIPVGYVDAYFKFVDHPRVTDACDVILANCYPFWEGCAADYALLYMKDMYRRAQAAAPGKQVIVSETGWPNKGTAFGAAVPSFENAIRYFLNTFRWAEEDGIDIFYFAAFDEAWKVASEGDVGAYWGLWDTHGELKYG